MTTVILETERLILDELQAGRDDLFIFQLLNEPGFLENIGDREIDDLEAASDYIETRQVQSYRQNGFGLWRAVSRETGQSLGLCGLVKRDGLEFPDVGYAFLESAWAKGYASEAAAATLAYARDHLGLKTLAAITKPDNKASMRVLEKVGFQFRRMITLPGHDGPSTYFTITI
ncbi:MAG: GNAT family N-acetyltransferase [Phenylobacterium zucineum]|nr:MAG: GNAT family N-acetyltransferase [Phenylobacterium zucineum]